jgi:hypothetical protein
VDETESSLDRDYRTRSRLTCDDRDGDEYAELRGVMIRGRCEILEDEASVRAAFEARAAAQASSSPVQPGVQASAPKRVLLRIIPEKVVSWDHRKLGGRC